MGKINNTYNMIRGRRELQNKGQAACSHKGKLSEETACESWRAADIWGREMGSLEEDRKGKQDSLSEVTRAIPAKPSSSLENLQERVDKRRLSLG